MVKKELYDDKFKEFAVRLSYKYGNIMKAARELNISYALLYRWRKDYSMLRLDFSNKKENEEMKEN